MPISFEDIDRAARAEGAPDLIPLIKQIIEERDAYAAAIANVAVLADEWEERELHNCAKRLRAALAKGPVVSIDSDYQPLVECGEVFRGRPGQDPCRKPLGHEGGPPTDWKRDYHSNGLLKWPVRDRRRGPGPHPVMDSDLVRAVREVARLFYITGTDASDLLGNAFESFANLLERELERDV